MIRIAGIAAAVLAILFLGGGIQPAGATDYCGSNVCTIVGTSGDDNISGTGSRDVICGLAGDDDIYGGDGDDQICGDEGIDYLEGSPGDDWISGGLNNSSPDTIFGEYYIPSVYPEPDPGDDLILGYGGNDDIYAQDGADTVWGAAGQDYISGGSGHDDLNGEDWSDTIYGGAGSDTIDGGPGTDSCYEGEVVSNCELP